MSKPDLDGACCRECVFYERYGDAAGVCRRFAPRAGNDIGEWPGVYSDDWCGEFVREIPNKELAS